MVHTIDRLVIVGCSSGGKESCDYLFPKLELGGSAAIIIPHISNREIYTSLKSQGLPAQGILACTPLRPGTIYVHGHKLPAKPSGSIGFLDGYIIPVPRGSDWIDDVFQRASQEYGERCIAVVLSGAGDDGARGVKHIVDNGGKVLVQSERHACTCRSAKGPGTYRCWYSRGMPTNAKRSIHPHFSGNLDRMATALNKLLAS